MTEPTTDTDADVMIDSDRPRTDAAATAESHPDAIPNVALTPREVDALERETVTVTYDPYQEDARAQAVTVDLAGHPTPTYGTDVDDPDREVRLRFTTNKGGIVSTHGRRIGRIRSVRIHGYSPAPKVERTYWVRVRMGRYGRSSDLETLPDRERGPLERAAEVDGYEINFESYDPVDRIYANREVRGFEIDAIATFLIEEDASTEEITEAGRQFFRDRWSYDPDDVEGTFLKNLDGSLQQEPDPETEPHSWVVEDGIGGRY